LGRSVALVRANPVFGWQPPTIAQRRPPAIAASLTLKVTSKGIKNPDADSGKVNVCKAIWAAIRFLLHVSPLLRFDIAASLSNAG
jgi:hypothetical protein